MFRTTKSRKIQRWMGGWKIARCSSKDVNEISSKILKEIEVPRILSACRKSRNLLLWEFDTSVSEEEDTSAMRKIKYVRVRNTI